MSIDVDMQEVIWYVVNHNFVVFVDLCVFVSLTPGGSIFHHTNRSGRGSRAAGVTGAECRACRASARVMSMSSWQPLRAA